LPNPGQGDRIASVGPDRWNYSGRQPAGKREAVNREDVRHSIDRRVGCSIRCLAPSRTFRSAKAQTGNNPSELERRGDTTTHPFATGV